MRGEWEGGKKSGDKGERVKKKGNERERREGEIERE